MIRLSILEWSLVAVCAVAVPTAAVQSWRAHSLSNQVTDLKAAGKACREANESNQSTIRDLQASIEQWETRCAFDPSAQNQAIANLNAATAALQSEAATAQSAREALYARDPDARSWSVTGMPADVAGSVFKRPGQNRPR